MATNSRYNSFWGPGKVTRPKKELQGRRTLAEETRQPSTTATALYRINGRIDDKARESVLNIPRQNRIPTTPVKTRVGKLTLKRSDDSPGVVISAPHDAGKRLLHKPNVCDHATRGWTTNRSYPYELCKDEVQPSGRGWGTRRMWHTPQCPSTLCRGECPTLHCSFQLTLFVRYWGFLKSHLSTLLTPINFQLFTSVANRDIILDFTVSRDSGI